MGMDKGQSAKRVPASHELWDESDWGLNSDYSSDMNSFDSDSLDSATAKFLKQ